MKLFEYNSKLRVRMFLRRSSRFADCQIRSTSTTHNANQDEEDEYEVETYIYEDSRLVRVAD